LWYGDLSRAEDLLKQSLQLAKECSNLYNQTLCNTYLAILYRQQRDFQNTRAFIDKSITTSTDRNMLNYLATAKGNQSWMALHYGRLDESQQLGLEALDLWSQVPFVYPFQWTALWPLIAVAVEQGNPDQAVDYARALLAEDQQCLPDQVSSELLAVIEAWKMNNHVEMINYFKKALSLAGKYRFL
jgi:tetratricopeptide (TPR) repeat protein